MPLKPEREIALRSLPNMRLGGLAIRLVFQAKKFSYAFCWSDRALLGGCRQRLCNSFKNSFKLT